MSIDSTDEELAALRAIAEGTASATGTEFFKSLVQHMASALHTKYAFVAEFCGENRVRTLAFWHRDRIGSNVDWDVRGTPCEDVVHGQLCHHPVGVAEKFPQDRPLKDMGIESYLGVPLLDAAGKHLGHLAVFDDRPMPPEPKQLFIFKIFAARAAAELDRLRTLEKLTESERLYRGLFDDAPLVYVYETLETEFVSINRAAQKFFGLRPDQVKGTIGMNLLADTGQTKQRIEEAFKRMRQEGAEQAWIEIELRRADNGQPIWAQFWSKPEPDGKHTRTMLVDITDRVLMEREKARLQQQNIYLQEEIKSVHNFDEIIGDSPALGQVLDGVRRVAPTDATTLILGESGTGKELIARAIHNLSARKDKPLIKVNCAALPAGLVESELFGHERGAFSGAITSRTGKFELADGGTIFLDEVGEIPLDTQVKLLRVLQEREFERVGGTRTIQVDVRVVAATNRDLQKAVQEQRFREDLFYRLNVFPIHLPPLRERAGDVPLLVQFLVSRLAQRIGKKITGISAASMDALCTYDWPGNVRELQNVLERAIILETDEVLEIPADLLMQASTKPARQPARVPALQADGSLESVEKQHIIRTLESTQWIIDGPNGAGKALGLHPNTLRSRMKKLGIVRP